MRVVEIALAYNKNLQWYNNVGSPTALKYQENSWCAVEVVEVVERDGVLLFML